MSDDEGQQPPAKGSSYQRLPRTVLPNRYEVRLQPNLDELNFTATCTIYLNVAEETDRIAFNALGLVVSRCDVTLLAPEGSRALVAPEIELDNEEEIFTVQLRETLGVGWSIRMEIQYTGTIQEGGRGLYACTAEGPEKPGEKQRFLSTYCEPTEIRRVIPCWDEPTFRAVFQLSVQIAEDLVAVSNTTIREVVPIVNGVNKEKVVHFQDTPIMCSYLLALVVGPLHHKERLMASGLPLRVYIPTCLPLDDVDFVLELADAAVEFFQKYFKFPFPLDKLDVVGVPELQAIAMENVGCQIFHLDYLRVNPRVELSRRQRITRLVGHEISHQWFGNIVSVEWWSHLWLKEGFARYLEFTFVESVRPQWEYWTFFLSQVYQHTLLLDLDPSRTHPIQCEVKKPREVGEIFDSISYEKGASVIRMLTTYLGPDASARAMGTYIARHQYSNTNPGHLWECLQEVAPPGSNFSAAMHQWITRPGHPLLRVECHEDDRNGEVIYTIQQSQMPDTSGGLGDPFTPYWIPLHWCSITGSTLEPHWTTLSELSHTLRVPKGTVVKINHNQTAVCNTAYGTVAWGRILANYPTLPALDRIGLCVDVIACVLVGVHSVTYFLDLLAAARDANECHPMVIVELAMFGFRLLLRCNGSTCHRSLQDYLMNSFRAAYTFLKVTPTDESNYAVESGYDPRTKRHLAVLLLMTGSDIMIHDFHLLFMRMREVVDNLRRDGKTSITVHQVDINVEITLLSIVCQSGVMACRSEDEELEVAQWLMDAVGVAADCLAEELVMGLSCVRFPRCIQTTATFMMESDAITTTTLYEPCASILMNTALARALLSHAYGVLATKPLAVVGVPTPPSTNVQRNVESRVRHLVWWMLHWDSSFPCNETLVSLMNGLELGLPVKALDMRGQVRATIDRTIAEQRELQDAIQRHVA